MSDDNNESLKRWRAPAMFPEMGAPLDARGNLCRVGDRVRSTPMLVKERTLTGTVNRVDDNPNCPNVIYVDCDDGRQHGSAAFLWEKLP